MRKVNTTITLDPRDKKEAMKLLKSFGLDLSTFVSIAIKQMIWDNKIPFDISRRIPNADTRQVLEKLKDMEKHPERFKSYTLEEALEMLKNTKK